MAGRRFGALLALVAVLSGCGGGGGGGSGGTDVAVAPAPTPTASSGGGCSLADRQAWASAQLREWYLFPEALPATLSPAGYSSVDDYVDALTATARSQRKDRYFTYLTSIREEDAFYSTGSSAGFGFRLSTDQAAKRVFIAETFEGTPALAAGVDRGAEILAVGTSAATLRPVSAIIDTLEGGVSAALGPSEPGVVRALRIADATGTREVTLTKAEYSLAPVSSRYGAKVIEDGGRRVGYVALRTFISSADPALRRAFADFRARGITEVIVDFRYNGGGLVSIAELMGDLLGGNRTTSDVFGVTAYRPEKSNFNRTRYFQPQPESIAPTRVAFIGTGATASASELVTNAFVPYLGANAALVGTNTFGKPVGQIALDRAACDDRLRVVAFATQNAARRGDYYDGLASAVQASCRAADDVNFPLGDPREASTRAALDFLAGRGCQPITAASGDARPLSVREGARELLTPDDPTPAQREVPGLF